MAPNEYDEKPEQPLVVLKAWDCQAGARRNTMLHKGRGGSITTVIIRPQFCFTLDGFCSTVVTEFQAQFGFPRRLIGLLREKEGGWSVRCKDNSGTLILSTSR
jgi:hypothetical protein